MGRGARGRPLPSDALPSPPLARALCRSVVGGAHLSPGVGVAGAATHEVTGRTVLPWSGTAAVMAGRRCTVR